jgi:hypothetical protein
MVPSVKEKWCEALRTGRYRQGNGVLNGSDMHGEFYCCLGVLREVMNKLDYTSSSSGQFLTYDQLCASGLSQEQQSFLAEMNDNGEKFSTIADYIETHIR